MNPQKPFAVTRAMLVILLFGGVLAQVVTPVIASSLGAQYPEAERLVVPYSAAAILAIGCVEVGLWLLWRLVALAEAGGGASLRALRLVSAIGACAAAVATLSAGVLVHLMVDVRFGGPGIVLLLLACIAAGTAGALIALRVRYQIRGSLLGFKAERHFALRDR